MSDSEQKSSLSIARTGTAAEVATVADLELRAELFETRQRHRALDEAIRALQLQSPGDQISLMRLKREKLTLKDKIALIEDQLRPDIIA